MSSGGSRRRRSHGTRCCGVFSGYVTLLRYENISPVSLERPRWRHTARVARNPDTQRGETPFNPRATLRRRAKAPADGAATSFMTLSLASTRRINDSRPVGAGFANTRESAKRIRADARLKTERRCRCDRRVVARGNRVTVTNMMGGVAMTAIRLFP